MKYYREVNDLSILKMTVYYTYLIGWKTHNKYYYGVRYAKNCQPDDLWNTYFTSSKHVKMFREENGEPDIIQIRKIFNDFNSARLWETKVLKRMNVINEDKWLNKNIAGAISLECCVLGGLSHRGLKKPKHSKNMLGKNNPMYGRKRIDLANRNKITSKINVGKLWFNNGVKNKRYFEYEIPFGWNKGMIMKNNIGATNGC